MKTLKLNLYKRDQMKPFQFKVKRMVNAGYVGRDSEAVKAHIEELKREGIPPPPSVPLLFPVLTNNITVSDQIEVVGERTSGEVEYVLLLGRENIFVGVGSDHTDRDLESKSITKSKQICMNVLSPNVWDYHEAKGHWDNLLIQSWVKAEGSDEEILYQKASLGTIITAEEIIKLVESKLVDGQLEGLVIFSGTVPILNHEFIYGSYFRCELIDSMLYRRLVCEYKIRKLDYLKDMECI